MLKTKNIYLAAIAFSIVLAIQLTLKGFELLADPSLGSSNRVNFWMGLEFFTICVLYLVWLYQIRAEKIALKFAQILRSALPFLVVAWAAYPKTHDIYLYLHYGLISLNRLNPYLTQSNEFQSIFTPFLDWNISSTYGIVSTFFFAISAKLSEISIFFGIYSFKFICLAFHVLNAYLIWRILRQDSRQSRVTYAYLLSPVLLFEQVAEAHLDVFLCTILIAIDQFLKHQKYLSALLMTGVGFLTKTLPLIWLPLIGMLLVRQKRWKTLALFSFISAIVILVLSLTLFPSIEAWRSIINPGVGTQTSGSWHNFLGGLLERTRGAIPPDVQALISSNFKSLMLVVFAIYYGVTLLKIYRKPNLLEGQLMVQIGWVTLVLFAFATPWYQPWYATILLPIAALNLTARFFAVTSFSFSMMGTIANFCFTYNQTRLGMAASFLTMGTVVLFLLLRPKLVEKISPTSQIPAN